MRAAHLLTIGLLACSKPRVPPTDSAPNAAASSVAPSAPTSAAAPIAASAAPLTRRSRGTWREAGRLSMARGGFALLTRPDGVVLVIGGAENGGDSRPSAYVDVYRPESGTWSRGPDLPTPRKSATIVALKDGGAAVLFGFASKGVVEGGERLDGKLGAWTKLKAPWVGSDIGAATLDDGRVLVAGGHDKATECMNECALWDPAKDAWEQLPRLPEPQVYGGLVVTGGKAHLFGGLCGDRYFPLRVLDPANKTWTSGPDGPIERIGESYTALADGRVLVAGGEPSKLAKDAAAVRRLSIFDPKTSQWSAGPALAAQRISHGATRLRDGRVMLAGGETESFHETASVEIFDPATNTVMEAAPLPRGVSHPSLVTLGDGRVLAVGGWVNTPGRFVGDAWLWTE
ncbi:MAG: hypothetical protein HYV09_00005 [Deltaproteobacteria bacterium]|nr:hypothetical protein [Deltaproteobacteria bacterium]